MASFTTVTFSGSTDTINLTFGYIEQSHVKVYLDGVLQTSGTDYTWLSSSQIKISAGNPSAGVVGRAQRVTPASQLVSLSSGNLDVDDLNLANLQALYVSEEANDAQAGFETTAWVTNDGSSGGTIEKGTEGYVPQYDASGNLVEGPSAAAIAAAQGYASAAATSASTASGAASSAASSATAADTAKTDTQTLLSAAGLPSSPSANAYLKRNAGNTAYDSKTPAEVLADIGAVATSRQVATGTGLIGGGDMSADRTIAADIANATDIANGTAGKLVDASGLAGASLGGWSSYPVGQIVYIADNLAGVEVPPTDQDFRFVKLTAGLTGVGQYNEGCLTSESVSGSAPLVLASAVVSLTGSPMSGETIRLLNTEGRILRPSTSAGTLQNDALQSHTHTLTTYNGTTSSTSPREQGTTAGATQTTSDHNGRSANETRMKNVGVTAYMRIK